MSVNDGALVDGMAKNTRYRRGRLRSCWPRSAAEAAEWLSSAMLILAGCRSGLGMSTVGDMFNTQIEATRAIAANRSHDA
jgi:hypothetical protein